MGPGNEKEGLRVLIPLAQFLMHDKTTNQSEEAKEMLLMPSSLASGTVPGTGRDQLQTDVENVSVKILSLEGTPFLVRFPRAGRSPRKVM